MCSAPAPTQESVHAGKHYKVELTDKGRKCQCVDHRIRKHDCKHIRLMLKTLGVESKPEDWFVAAQQLVSAQAASLGVPTRGAGSHAMGGGAADSPVEGKVAH